jgi:predicted ATPase
VEAAWREVHTGLALIGDQHASWYVAEMYRIKGVIVQTAASTGHYAGCTAEECLQQALTLARQQQARMWELRAATSLARLWQMQDRRQDAYDLLAPVYGWFSEGFDVADLQEAKALLEELR